MLTELVVFKKTKEILYLQNGVETAVVTNYCYYYI